MRTLRALLLRVPALGAHGRRLLLALAGASILVSVTGLAVASAADPFVAGQPAARPVALPDGGRAAEAQARRLAATIGIHAPVVGAATRLDDRLEGAIYDEVTFRDDRGRPTLLVRLRPDGSLRQLARLDAPDMTKRDIPAADVPSRAAAAAHAAGLRPVGAPAVRDDPTSGWSAAWGRLEAGIPVLGDGTWVRLDRDGTVRSVASTASPLASRPITTLKEVDARRLAESRLDAVIAPASRDEVHVSAARLAWVSPNDTFDATRPDAPSAVHRLAWVVRVVSSGQLAEGLRGLELDLDAGSGELLGGDVLE